MEFNLILLDIYYVYTVIYNENFNNLKTNIRKSVYLLNYYILKVNLITQL